jgi:MFS family permease
MFFEVCLIQKLTLFLGYPTYSLSVTLFSLLVFSGIGSLASRRYAGQRNRALLALLVGVFALTLFYQFGVEHLVDVFAGAPLVVRVALTALLLAPLGLCLGAFMPIGLFTVARLTDHGREYVAWAWAVNGFFSVVSSVLATILSMSFGFRVVLLLAATIYAIGIVALTRVPETRTRAA